MSLEPKEVTGTKKVLLEQEGCHWNQSEVTGTKRCHWNHRGVNKTIGISLEPRGVTDQEGCLWNQKDVSGTRRMSLEPKGCYQYQKGHGNQNGVIKQ